MQLLSPVLAVLCLGNSACQDWCLWTPHTRTQTQMRAHAHIFPNKHTCRVGDCPDMADRAPSASPPWSHTLSRLLCVDGLQHFPISSAVIKAFCDSLGWVLSFVPFYNDSWRRLWLWEQYWSQAVRLLTEFHKRAQSFTCHLEEITILCTGVHKFHLTSCLGPLQVSTDNNDISVSDHALILIPALKELCSQLVVCECQARPYS